MGGKRFSSPQVVFLAAAGLRNHQGTIWHGVVPDAQDRIEAVRANKRLQSKVKSTSTASLRRGISYDDGALNAKRNRETFVAKRQDFAVPSQSPRYPR